ncbi:cobalt-zinc-cadmium efflux system protein [Breoghania corrubedonensis]|uniref:Cobalt-zinc-cadmium efflux system protein n=1 Tax=Breoghania corrubedonensis TaxID=665038 RepID=A0A2T5VCN8_9HYPH|nr:cation diffusion facilitator family transporter [Breoghania corrubedonensis]PTW61518.1 cobalt-zinc-cadmium efflux system protein [Breoghania corrubedonensis]
MGHNHTHDHDADHVHSRGNGHGHHHHHVDPNAGDLRITFAIGINFLLTLVQIVGGIMAGSLALIADALHNFSDAISLVIAFGARKIARRPSDAQMTFGYDRIEIVAALINYTTLIILGLYLVYEAVLRFIEPEGVDGWMVIIIAIVALVIDLGTALLTYAMSKSSMNIRAAFLHNVADALGSVAVIVAGTLILLYDWRLIDPIVTLLIAGYILWQSFLEIGPVIRILMLASPPDIAAQSVLDSLRDIEGVADVHHVHLWQMNEHQNAVDAHLVIAEGFWERADTIKASAKQRLKSEFGVGHTTLEMECTHHVCLEARAIGH